jgi:hypothetical protein
MKKSTRKMQSPKLQIVNKHWAAAIASGCDELWTNDGRLTRAADNRIRIITIDQLA